MRVFALLPTVFAGALTTLATAVPAQTPMVTRVMPGAIGFRSFDAPRAVIGITTSSAATNRDTLGVLVSSVRSGSPAEKAGIEEGNRIASINGVSLKLAAADVGDYEMANAMSRRLTRELDKLKPGDEVDLRVVADGQTKTVKVKTIAPDDLRSSIVRRTDEDRATLGISIISTGTARDSLGVMVLGIEDNSPAAKAGIEEGTRIASINGVDLRERDASDDDIFTRMHNPSRFERAMDKLKPGDDADLRVYFNGQYRNLKVKTVRASDLPRHGRSITIMRDDRLMPAMPILSTPDLSALRQIPDRVQHVIDAMPRVGNRVAW